MSANFWDHVSEEKSFSHPLDLERFRRLVPLSARILDYGCGYGRICRQLADAGFQDILGIDSSSRMIERARRENPDIQFASPGGTLPRASFDAVLLFSVLTCIPEDSRQRELVAEIHDLLRPGGLLYVSDLLVQEDERNERRYRQFAGRFGRWGVFELEPGVVFRHMDRLSLDHLFAQFHGEDFVELTVLTMNGNPARAFQYFGRC